MLEWGLTSTVLILVVLLLRRVLRGKVSNRGIYALWLIVLIRLLVPVTFFDSPLGIMNFIPEQMVRLEEESAHLSEEGEEQERIDSGNGIPMEGQITKEPLDGYVNGNAAFFPENAEGSFDNIIGQTGATQSQREAFDGTVPLYTNEPRKEEEQNAGYDQNQGGLFVLWAAGCMTCILIMCTVNFCFYRKLVRSRKKIKQNIYPEIDVYCTDAVVSPCLFGLFHPSIYLNRDAMENENVFYHVLTHEYTHYRHLDYFWAFLRMAALCIHWYHPLVWYGAYVSIQDCELACDEGTIKRIGDEQRIVYGETLLHMIAVGRRFSNVCSTATTMVDNKKNIKLRILSIAEKAQKHKWALALMLFVMIFAVLCTFTGKVTKEEYHLDISRSDLNRLLLETGGYEKNILYDIYEADYDKDNVMEAFLVVLKEDGIAKKNREEQDESSADIWYYDGKLVLYKEDEMVVVPKEHIYVMELSDKTFFVYEQLYGENSYKSRVLGIRDGEILDYFRDPKLTEYFNGQLYDSEGNDLRLYVKKMNAEKNLANETYSGSTVCTEYAYYDASVDMFRMHTAYEKTEEEILKLANAEEILESVKKNFPQYGVSYTYAVRDKFLHIMVETPYEDSYGEHKVQFYYYTYELNPSSVGDLVESGRGFYDDLNEQSVQEVRQKEWEDYNQFLDFLKDWENSYSNLTIQDGNFHLLTHYFVSEDSESEEGITVLDTRTYASKDGRATLWLYTVHGTGDVRIWTIDEEYEKKDGGYYFVNGGEFELECHENIMTLDEFKKAYYLYGDESVPWEGSDYLKIPDLFHNGMADDIADEKISAYYEPDTAAICFFHLSGGTVTDLTYEKTDAGGKRASLTYVFADGSSVDLYLYETYQGIWLPLEFKGQNTTSSEVNEWFTSLTQEEFAKAKRMDDTAEWYQEKILLLEEFAELGVKIYADPYGGIVVEKDGERKLFDKCYLTTRVSFPQFKAQDFDGDGQTEIGMISYVGSGTGVSIEDFCIIDGLQDGTVRLYTLSNAVCMDEIRKRTGITATDFGVSIKLRVDEENVLTAIIDCRGTELETAEISDICVGEQISYLFGENGEVICEALLGIGLKNSVIPYYLRRYGDEPKPPVDAVRVNVTYDGKGGFILSDYRYGVME